MWFYDLMLFLFSQTWPDTSSKQELWWNGPQFSAEALDIQKLLLNSMLFSFQTGALRCLAKRPAHFPCSYVVLTCFKVYGFLSTSAMFFQLIGYLKCQIPMVGPQLSGGFLSKAKQLTTSPRMRATRRWWTSWNQFLGINDPRADHRKWSMGWERLGSDHQKKVMLCYSNCTTPVINSNGVSCKIRL